MVSGLLAKASLVLSEAVSVEGSGCRLYELMCAEDEFIEVGLEVLAAQAV